jgi:hypothetical protein
VDVLEQELPKLERVAFVGCQFGAPVLGCSVLRRPDGGEEVPGDGKGACRVVESSDYLFELFARR